MQKRYGDGVTGQNNPGRTLMPRQLFDGLGHLPGEIQSPVYYPALVALLIESSRLTPSSKASVHIGSGQLTQKPSPRDEQPGSVRIYQGDHSGFVLVDQAGELEKVRHRLQHHLIIERHTALERFKEL